MLAVTEDVICYRNVPYCMNGDSRSVQRRRNSTHVLNMALDAEDCLIRRCPQIDSSIVQACVLENKYQLLPNL